MERTSFSLLFYIRRTKLNKFGEAPIFMRLTVNVNRSDASVKRFIAPRLWNSSKGKATEKGLGCREDVYKRQVMGRAKAYEAIVKGDNLPKPGIPEAMNVLLHELRGLALSVKLE